MRFIRYVIYAALAVVLVVLCLANRETVTLNTLPEGLAAMPQIGWMAFSIDLPLYFVVLIGLVLGFALGELFEYIREHKHRVEAREKGAEARRLQRQLKQTEAERDKDKDEVLAILDQSR